MVNKTRLAAGIILVLVGVAAVSATYFVLLRPSSPGSLPTSPTNTAHNPRPLRKLPNYTLSAVRYGKALFNANLTDNVPLQFVPNDQSMLNYSHPQSGTTWQITADFQTSTYENWTVNGPPQAYFWSDSKNGLTLGMNTENNPTREWMGDGHEENDSSIYATAGAIPGAKLFVLNLTFPTINNLSTYLYAGYTQEEDLGFRILSGFGNSINVVIIHAIYTSKGISFEVRGGVSTQAGVVRSTFSFNTKPNATMSHEVQVSLYTDGKGVVEVAANGEMIYSISKPGILAFSTPPRLGLEMFTTIDYINITGSFSHIFAYPTPNMTVAGLPSGTLVKVADPFGGLVGVFNQSGVNGTAVVADLTLSPFNDTLYLMTNSRVVGSSTFPVLVSSTFKVTAAQP
jgi:hypothetical protein